MASPRSPNPLGNQFNRDSRRSGSGACASKGFSVQGTRSLDFIPMMSCVARSEDSDSRLIPLALQYSETQVKVDALPRCSVSSAAQTCGNDRSSPASTLLEELLIMIFDDVIASESSSCLYGGSRLAGRISSPRNLASVSRGWRTIVFACPKLWRHVHLTPYRSIHGLKEQLLHSSPIFIHLIVHQWPFRSPSSASGPLSIVALVAQLQSIISSTKKEGAALVPASQRVELITINATESSTFLNFVLQTWTGPGPRFPALRQVTINGNVCAPWSRACFFDGRNAPGLERLELNNVVIAHNAYRSSRGIGPNLTTLVWTAPAHKNGSLVVSVSCFHHVVSSFPNLTTLELHGHAVTLEFATLESLEENAVTPLTHVRTLRISGQAFPNSRAAYMLFYLLPSARHVMVRGSACSGPLELRTVSFALQGLINLPLSLGWPMVLPNVEYLELECVEDGCAEWSEWSLRELELRRQWREMVANMGRDGDAAKMRVHLTIDDG